MSRDAPSLDEIYGHGAEAADDFAGHLDTLWEHWSIHASRGDPAGGIEKVYNIELTRMWEENRVLEEQLVSAGEEIERLRAQLSEESKHE